MRTKSSQWSDKLKGSIWERLKKDGKPRQQPCSMHASLYAKALNRQQRVLAEKIRQEGKSHGE